MARPIGKKSDSGGITAPRWSNGNIDWNKVRQEYITDIIAGQIAPNTLRGIMYILKSKNVLKKSDYHGLIIHCRDWRKQGLIGWTDIVDGSGRGVINDFGDYSTIPDYVDFYVNYLRNGGKNYRSLLKNKWRWYGQPNYVEIWCEKHAMRIFAPYLLNVRHLSYDDSFDIIREWLDRCDQLQKITFNFKQKINEGLRGADRTGCLQISRDKLEEENEELHYLTKT